MAPLTEKESQVDRPVGISPSVVLACIVAIVLVIVSAVTYLVVVGREIDQVVAIVSLIGAPTVLSLLSLLKQDRAEKVVETVRKNTNGALSRMQDQLDRISDTGPIPVISETTERSSDNG